MATVYRLNRLLTCCAALFAIAGCFTVLVFMAPGAPTTTTSSSSSSIIATEPLTHAEQEAEVDDQVESCFGMRNSSNTSSDAIVAPFDKYDLLVSWTRSLVPSYRRGEDMCDDGSITPGPVEHRETLRWYAASREDRPTFDAYFPKDRLMLVPSLVDCIDPASAASHNPGNSGLMLLDLVGAGIAGLPTFLHLYADLEGKIAVASNLALTLLRAEEDGSAIGVMYSNLLQRLHAGLSLARKETSLNGQQDEGEAMATRFMVMRTHQEYFYCVGDYTAPGDQLVLTLGCMGRYFARYPSKKARRRVAVLFPEPSAKLEGLANTLQMLMDHITETRFILLPLTHPRNSTDQKLGKEGGPEYIYFPASATVVFPSKIPTYSVAMRDFVQNVLVPRILANRTLRQSLEKHRRISLVGSSGKSLTGRSLTLTNAWTTMIETFGFVTLPSDLPMAARVFYLAHCELMISSRGSNDAISHHLMSSRRGAAVGEVPRLVLSPSAYGGAIPGTKPCSMMQPFECPHTAPIYFLFLGYYRDNLSLVPGDEIQDFLNAANRYMESHPKPFRSQLGWNNYFP